jgi:hypothetical protein
MRNLRTLSAALVLTLVLTMPALAGHIETMREQPQPTPAPASVTSNEETNVVSADGHIETPAAIADATAQATLNLISAVLALF